MPIIDEIFTVEDLMRNKPIVSRALANQKPSWTPGDIQFNSLLIKNGHTFTLIEICCKHVPLRYALLYKGEGLGYHSVSIGLYHDQIVRRVDPKRRSLAQFFKEELADPMGW